MHRRHAFAWLAAAAFLAPFAAHAQFPPPPLPLPPGLVFHAPPVLVEVSPGLQVVPDYDHEVFYFEGRYWLRHEGHWYRSRGNRWEWRLIEMDRVPYGLRRHKQGHYRRWKPPRHEHRGHHADRPPPPPRLQRAEPPPPRLQRADDRRDDRRDRRDDRQDRRKDRDRREKDRKDKDRDRRHR